MDCPKCGAQEVNSPFGFRRIWLGPAFEPFYRYYKGAGVWEERPERLRYRCRECDYARYEPCKDAPSDGTTRADS